MEERGAGRERIEAEEDVRKPGKRIGGSPKDGRRLRWMMAWQETQKERLWRRAEGCGGEHKAL